MRIIQITDLHIGRTDENSHGVDVRSNFLNILAEVKFAKPDYLVITGDLCLHEGHEAVYQWIKARLLKLGIPFYLIPGNHDDSALMREVFEMNFIKDRDELYYAVKLGRQTCLFMDNAAARHSEVQLLWLKRQLYQAEDETLLLFTHYPPYLAGVPFMDTKHPLQDMEAIQPILQNYAAPIHVFCGHYHVEKTLHTQNTHVHITPSCYVQIGQEKVEFEADHHRIAMRIIDVENSMITTTVRYFEGAQL